MAQTPLSDRTISEIRLLAEIARVNTSHISIQDIATLTSVGLDEAEIRAVWEATPGLRSFYDLRQDFLVDRNDAILESSIQFEVLERKTRARQFTQYARQFQKFYRAKGATVLSVSGSTSYDSTQPGDDLDFFTITNDGALWIYLFKSMVLARIYRQLHPGFPKICFSYSIDERFARKAFATEDLLFARDALSVIVLHGENYYRTLLKRNSWMANYFPRLYQIKTGPPDEEAGKSGAKSPLLRFLNLFLYFTMGPYLRFKSSQVNRNLRGKTSTGSFFTLKSGPDHFIFESVRYQRLRQIYDKLGKTIRTESTVNGDS